MEEKAATGETRTNGLFSACSPPHPAPAQRLRTKTGQWTDVHALGLVLTKMLTGHDPYRTTDRAEIEWRIVSDERPTPATFGLDVGPWEAVIARAVTKRPGERFRDAGSFLAALEAHVPDAHARPGSIVGPTELLPPHPASFGAPEIRGGSAPPQETMSSTTVPAVVRARSLRGKHNALWGAGGAALLVAFTTVVAWKPWVRPTPVGVAPAQATTLIRSREEHAMCEFRFPKSPMISRCG